jgi:GTP-binding protein
VIVRAVPGLSSLVEFRYRRRFAAQNGRPGSGRNKTGKDGRNVVIEVPQGTLLYDKESNELLADLTEAGQELVLLPGGRGGRGNQHFATSTNRAPRKAQPGIPGQVRKLRLSLKYLADVCLVGLPNAGKSTLISRLSMARPKIDSYPFTTLVPNLGVLTLKAGKTVTLADIPGLIEGAGQGRGLGHRFLKHIERTRLLLHLLDLTYVPRGDPLEDFRVLQGELESYDPGLLKKEQMVAINKIDLAPEAARNLDRVKEGLEKMGLEVIPISALTGQGLDRLKQALYRRFFHDRNQ